MSHASYIAIAMSGARVMPRARRGTALINFCLGGSVQSKRSGRVRRGHMPWLLAIAIAFMPWSKGFAAPTQLDHTSGLDDLIFRNGFETASDMVVLFDNLGPDNAVSNGAHALGSSPDYDLSNVELAEQFAVGEGLYRLHQVDVAAVYDPVFAGTAPNTGIVLRVHSDKGGLPGPILATVVNDAPLPPFSPPKEGAVVSFDLSTQAVELESGARYWISLAAIDDGFAAWVANAALDAGPEKMAHKDAVFFISWTLQPEWMERGAFRVIAIEK